MIIDRIYTIHSLVSKRIHSFVSHVWSWGWIFWLFSVWNGTLVVLCHIILNIVWECSQKLVWRQQVVSIVYRIEVLMAVDWQVNVWPLIFHLLIINTKICEIPSHFVVILFHLLLEMRLGWILCLMLIEALPCSLPSKLRTFWKELIKLLHISVIISWLFIFSRPEPCVKSLWGLWGLKELLLWSWWLYIHLILIVSKHVVSIVIILGLRRDEVVWSVRWVVSFHLSLLLKRLYYSFGLMKGFFGFWGG